ncbi:MAG TPA: hypothetical protein VNY33_03805 [Gaiellaceae bacterium]|jgi:hypothetical protein|nr:hypothetical protein [Gaiellaceae bacterium]
MQVSGGTDGNARLTGTTAAVLLLLLAVEGATLLSLRSFLSWHIFVGMLLVPIVLLKIAATGYKFARYYRGSSAYRQLGPPTLALRLLGPVVVVSTACLFATGVALIVRTPGGGRLLLLHKASFAVWVAALTVHVLAHLTRIPRLTVPDLRGGEGVAASRLRLTVVAAVIVAGAILAVATVPLIGPWVNRFNSSH